MNKAADSINHETALREAAVFFPLDTGPSTLGATQEQTERTEARYVLQ
jgi:hypothetical protein